jgi:hypothetical protein
MSANYGIQWAYGEFRITRFSHDKPAETWISPKPVSDLRELSAAMHEASQHVDVDRGGSVAIVYEDDLHTHEFLQIPKLDRKPRNKYLERRVEASKPFAGKAAWCYSKAEAVGKLDGVLLHLMPKNIVDAILRICGEHFLTPSCLIPVTDIISERVSLTGVGDTSSILVIASFNARTQMLVCRGTGEVVLVRELNYSCTEPNYQRLLIDIRRTAGYAKQNVGSTVDNILFVGELAAEIAAPLERELSIPTTIDEESCHPSFWMTQVAHVNQGIDSNFIPSRERRTINSRTLIRAGVLTTALTAAAALCVATVIEYLIARTSVDLPAIEASTQALELEQSRLRTQLDRVDEVQSQLNEVNIDAFNLPALFASHLGDLVPPGLTLSRADIRRIDEGWEFSLAGVSDSSLSATAPVLAELETRLAGTPWNATVVDSWRSGWMEQLRSGQAATNSRVAFELRSRFK